MMELARVRLNFPVVFLKCEMKSMYKEALVGALVNIYQLD
jgi:hypothetical protein